MNRYAQLAIWILLAPIFGGIQGVASFSLPVLQDGDPGSHDLMRLLAGLAFVYGGGWFIPALVVSDLLMLRRTLSRSDLARYASLIAITALVVGLFMPGIMVMLGYPTTACAILLYGFFYRRRHSVQDRANLC